MIIANMAAKSSNMKKIRLVDVIRKKYPGLSGRQAFSILQDMRRKNNGTLMGMKFSKFKRLLLKIQRERWSQAKEMENIALKKTRALNKTCLICYRFFVTKASRDMHVKIVHEKTHVTKKVDSSTFACSQCDKKYSHEVLLKRHSEIHKDVKVDISCDLCGKIFTRKDNLWRHREMVLKLLNMNIDALMEKNERKCNMCNREFDNMDILVSNMSLKACSAKLTVEEKFQCGLCDKSYFYKSDLRRHVRTKHDRNSN